MKNKHGKATRKHLSRKKHNPEKFISTGVEKNQIFDIQIFEYNKQKVVEKTGLQVEEIKPFIADGNMYWLNVYGLTDPDKIAALCQGQNIHSLAIQDILDVNQRPKFQEYDDFSFLTLKSIVPSENEMLTEQISFVFNAHFLLSFQERKADFFEHLRVRLREDNGIVRERGGDFLLYALLEAILDNYFKTLNKLEEEIEQLNFSETSSDPFPGVLAVIEDHKKFVQFIKKSILPIKEFTQAVERGECLRIEKRHRKYFLEIKDICLTLIDNSDMMLASLESATNLFFSVQGHRMNQVMKTLTIVATIFIPLTFIAGIYGMNFENMPELQWQYGYFSLMALMTVAFVAMVIYFKRKKWF